MSKSNGTWGSDFNGANAIQRWRPGLRRGGGKERNGLQWGQRHSALETIAVADGRAPIGYTSMGPTPFSVGDTPRRRRAPRGRLHFNGANAIQRWRPGGEMSCNQPYDHFNGANAIQRWRREPRQPAAGLLLPSMGPTPFSVGDRRPRSK